MNIATLSTSTSNSKGDPDIIRALQTLTDAGFSFEVIERCPVECLHCAEALPRAA